MIPVTVAPRAWEQLGGCLLGVARQLECTPADLMRRARGPRLFDIGTSLAGVSGLPDEQQIEAVSELCDLDSDDVVAMTMWRFLPGLFGVPSTPGSAGASATAPSLLEGGVFCVSCVRDGHWDLRWRTGLVGVCVDHGEYVLARCPRCDGLVTPESVRVADAPRGLLVHGASDVRTCTWRLTSPRASVARAHLTTQLHLNRLLDAAQHDLAAAAICRDVLRCAEWLHRPRGEGTFLTGGFVNVDQTELGAILTTALTLAQEPEQNGRVPVILVDEVIRHRAFGLLPAKVPLYAPFGPGPDRLVETLHAAAHNRPATPVAPLSRHDRHGDTIPQVIPLSLLDDRVFDHLDFLPLDRARMVAAVCCAMPPGGTGWRATARRLGLPPALGARAADAVTFLERQERSDNFWRAIAELRSTVVRLGVDFRARAALVLGDDQLVANAIDTWPELGGMPASMVRQWLLDRWACQYIATLPGGLAGRRNAAGDTRADVDNTVAATSPVESIWSTWNPIPVPDRASG